MGLCLLGSRINLTCWERHLRNFSVEISCRTTVGALKNVIKHTFSSEFAHVSTKQLFLYKLSEVTSIASLEMVLETLGEEDILSELQSLSDIFPGGPPTGGGHIHVLVSTTTLSRSTVSSHILYLTTFKHLENVFWKDLTSSSLCIQEFDVMHHPL